MVAIVLAGLLLLAGCASQMPGPEPGGAADPARPDLGCTLSSNCVSSTDSAGLAPLKYGSDPARAMASLLATLASFSEAQVVRSEPLRLVAIFTTRLGFRDEVVFRIDAQAQRIDYRSRSLFGLFDFGKNRSRMQAFAARFEQQR
jgi:uncharacterized protein (DUF1499 family)